MKGASNRLAGEKSPYLAQHAGNPVDWYPWGPEAFDRARREDRPIFLSIGYSTCHWCHVMAHESFEDPEVAALMNEAFVNIKVDREERPDIDGVYMAVCQMMTGGGGWPLTILMTADRRPFFAGTYIPRTTRFGRIGMLDFVPRIQEIWTSRRGDLLEAADQITQALRRTTGARTTPPPGVAEAPTIETVELGFRQLARTFDAEHGGFGHAPKFPTPHMLTFLLRYHQRTGAPEALEMVETTLRNLRRGGIYDQLGFGFHRYSTDERWLVPHFEKMLYDQALLALAYLEAYQVGGDELHARTAREIFTYVLRDMTDTGGGFHSAEDADSEGEEGKYYLWTADELRRVLGEADARLATERFGVREEGNFRDEATGQLCGANILHLRADPDGDERMEAIRARLLEQRERRVRPARDDKILADWNGLMIAALARGAQVLGEESYAAAASRAAEFVLTRMRGPDGALRHRFRDGDAAFPALLDDHAFLVWGLIELYQATFEPRHLERALSLNREMLERYWDPERGALFTAAADAEDLLVRQKSIHDGAVPSGNSVALWNLLRLCRITGEAALEERADALARSFSERVGAGPAAFTQFLVGLDFGLGPTHEVVVAGDPGAGETRQVLRRLQRAYLPRAVLLLRPDDEGQAAALAALVPSIAAQRAIDGRPTIYVCQGFECRRPTTDVAQALAALAGEGSEGD